jgi:GT2 family glycosyltransferase
MYGEDLDWCKRFTDANWRIVFEPNSRAIHYGAGSSRQAPLRFYVELERANHQYWAKYYALPSRLAYAFIRIIHHGVRLIYYGLRRLTAPSDNSLAIKTRGHAVCLLSFFRYPIRRSSAA